VAVSECPSCGPDFLYSRGGQTWCGQCGAQLTGSRWRAGRRGAVPKAIKPLDRTQYIECEECSEAAGERVIYHRSALVKETDFWGGTEAQKCPKGHTVPEVPA
jgi:hypothetical protein